MSWNDTDEYDTIFLVFGIISVFLLLALIVGIVRSI